VRYPVPELPTIPSGASVTGVTLAEDKQGIRSHIENGEKLFLVATEKFYRYYQPILPPGVEVYRRQPITNANEACTIIMPETATIDECVDAVTYVTIDARNRGVFMIEVLLISPYTNRPQTIYVSLTGDEEEPGYEYRI